MQSRSTIMVTCFREIQSKKFNLEFWRLRGRFHKLILVGFCFYFLVDFSSQIPGKSTYGQSISPPSEWRVADESSFVIATYNIRRGKGDDGKRDIKRAASVLKHMDCLLYTSPSPRD